MVVISNRGKPKQSNQKEKNSLSGNKRFILITHRYSYSVIIVLYTMINLLINFGDYFDVSLNKPESKEIKSILN